MELMALVCTVAAVWCWPGRARQRRPTTGFALGRGKDNAPTSRPTLAARGRSSSTARASDVAAAMELLALVTASGRGVGEAMDRVAAVSPERVRRDLATVVAAQAWGVDARRSWQLVPFVWAPAAAALTLAVSAGVAPSGILVRAADDCRAAQAEALDLAAGRLGVRLVLPLGLAFLPAFVLLTVVPLVLALAGQVLA